MEIACGLLLFAATHAQSDNAPAQASPSFDCRRAASAVEKMVCTSPDLAALDNDMQAAFDESGLKTTPWFVKLQKSWLHERDRCATTNCAADAYRKGIASIEMLANLDEEAEGALSAVFDIAKEQAPIEQGQVAWRQTLAQCRDFDCAAQRLRNRIAALSVIRNTVARAGMATYRNPIIGLQFQYRTNRWIVPCDESHTCIQLMGKAMGYGSPYLLEIRILKGNLSQAADQLWERRGKTWVASGRGMESDVVPYEGKWHGLLAEVTCGIGDKRTGFHGAGGTCNTYLLSNGKWSVAMQDDGVSGKDEATQTTVDSMQVLRQN